MTVLYIVIALAVLALITQAGVLALNRIYPTPGEMIDVAGARLRVVQVGPREANGLPVVMLHGASSNLESMRQPLGDMLARNRRVIMIDRPGHGGSTRERLEDSPPAIQARMIDEALGKLGVDRAILVAHSLAGALGAAIALDYPQRVAGLAMLAPVTHPWPGGVGVFNKIVTLPVIGPIFAYTIPLPIGWFLVEPGARYVFAPQPMPEGYARATALALLLRPQQFLANAWDLVTLKPEVARQALRYGELKMPILVVHGDADRTVSVNIHSRAFARDVPDAKLIVLPNVGHMPQNAAPDLIAAEIEKLAQKAIAKPSAAVAR